MAVIDIVIPCFRYGRYLKDCVASIQSQSLSDVRVLIIDDASPDDSADVARALAATDPRISVSVHRRNLGAIPAYNEGIAWAEAPFFMVLSADDFIAPGALARASAVMAANPGVVLTYGRWIDYFDGAARPTFVDAETKASWRIHSGQAFIAEQCADVRNRVATPTVIVRTETQKAIGGYEPSLPHTSDMEMWLRFAAHGDVADTPSVQGVYRVHGSNMSSGYYDRVMNDYEHRLAAIEFFFDRSGSLVPDALRLRGEARQNLGKAAFWTGVAQLCRGDLETGRAVLRFGLELHPRMAFCPPLTHLLQMERVDEKLRSVAADLMRRLRERPIRTSG